MSTIHTKMAPDLAPEPADAGVEPQPLVRPARRERREPRPAGVLRKLTEEVAALSWAAELAPEIAEAHEVAQKAIQAAQVAVDHHSDLEADVAAAKAARVAAAREGKSSLPKEIDEVEGARRLGGAERAVAAAVDAGKALASTIRSTAPGSVEAVIERRAKARAEAAEALKAARAAVAEVQATDILLHHLDEGGYAGKAGRRGSGWFTRPSLGAGNHNIPGALRAGVVEMTATDPWHTGEWVTLNAWSDMEVPIDTRKALAERGGREGGRFLAALEKYEREVEGRPRSALMPSSYPVEEDDVQWMLECVRNRDLPPVARR